MVELWKLNRGLQNDTSVPNNRFEAIRTGYQTAFLSHSHQDREYVLGLQALLLRSGWKVYLDWQDEEMPNKPTEETAAKIVERIEGNEWFLFLATDNSLKSRWCPWEVGIAHEAKERHKLAIVMTRNIRTREMLGNEYYHLYRRMCVPDIMDTIWFAEPGDKYMKTLAHLNKR